jgi:hypothetical protein
MSPNPELANTDLVLLAMLIAGAGDDFIDLEDIAIEAYRLSPQRFGWRTKPYPSDKLLVQAIADLERRHKDGRTLRGTGKAPARMLTAEGRKAALRVGSRMAGIEFSDVAALIDHFEDASDDARLQAPAERRPAQADLTELRRHHTFQVWEDEGGDLSSLERWELLDAVSCLPDAPQTSVREQTEKLMAQAERWSDSEAIHFLNDLSKAATANGG